MPFRDLSGHRSVHALLPRAVARAVLPHSLLFAARRCRQTALGARARTAPQLPAAGPATRGERPDACGRVRRAVASPRTRIRTSCVPDGGAAIAEMARDVLGPPASGRSKARRRVFIFDEADTLSAVVQNALLKTLEEPSATSQFVLVSARPDVLLPTVRSRCPMLRFGRLPLDRRGAVEDCAGVGPARVRLPLAADGSPGRALVEVSDRQRHPLARGADRPPGRERQRGTAAATGDLLAGRTRRARVRRGRSRARRRLRSGSSSGPRRSAGHLRDLGVAGAGADAADVMRAGIRMSRHWDAVLASLAERGIRRRRGRGSPSSAMSARSWSRTALLQSSSGPRSLDLLAASQGQLADWRTSVAATNARDQLRRP